MPALLLGQVETGVHSMEYTRYTFTRILQSNVLYTLPSNPNLQAVCEEHPATDGCLIPMPDTTVNADCRHPAANSKGQSVN